jgi:MFS family permease
MKSTGSLELNYYGVLATLLLATFMASLAISSTNILLPELVVSLDTTFTHVQWVSVSYLIFMSSTLVISGSLSDLFDRRQLFIVGIVIFTLSACLCGISSNIWLLTTFRACQGVGAAILITVNMAMVGDLFPQHKVPAIIGLIGSLSAIGTASGPIIGGLGSLWLNWNTVFLMNVPLGLTLLFMAIHFIPTLKETKQINQKIFDYRGALFLFLTIICYALSLKYFTAVSLLVSVILISFTSLFLIFFIASQGAVGPKLLQLSVMRDYRYSVGFGVNFLVSTVVISSLVVSPFYLTIVFNLSVAQTGLVMAASPVCVAITSFIISRILSDKNTNTMITGSVALLMVGTSCLSYFNQSFGVVGYIACLAITAMGYGTFTSSNNTQIMKMAARSQRGQISGLLHLSRNLGLLSGTTLMSSLFALTNQITAMGSVKPSTLDVGLNRVYSFATTVLCVALILSFYKHKKDRQKHNI